jgi:hypothetical protein
VGMGRRVVVIALQQPSGTNNLGHKRVLVAVELRA